MRRYRVSPRRLAAERSEAGSKQGGRVTHVARREARSAGTRAEGANRSASSGGCVGAPRQYGEHGAHGYNVSMRSGETKNKRKVTIIGVADGEATWDSVPGKPYGALVVWGGKVKPEKVPLTAIAS